MMGMKIFVSKLGRHYSPLQRCTLNSFAFMDPYKDAKFLSPVRGVVVERIGDRVMVESQKGDVLECRQRKGLESHNIVVGDWIHFQTMYHGNHSPENDKDDKEHVVVGYETRKNLISRTDPKQPRKVKYIASNIDQMLIVAAVEPPVQLLSIDRLLVAAEYYGMKSSIIVNKCDLEESKAYVDKISFYEKLNYPVIPCHVDTSLYELIDNDNNNSSSPDITDNVESSGSIDGPGLAHVRAVLSGKTSLLIGQSGVGKSSITNELIASPYLLVGGLTRRGMGSHVTSTATLHRVQPPEDATGVKMKETNDDGSWVVDSPGLREFGLKHLSEEDIQRGFPDIDSYAADCKYRNCRHTSGQHGCAVLSALDAGEIEFSRWQNYHQILSENKRTGKRG